MQRLWLYVFLALIAGGLALAAFTPVGNGTKTGGAAGIEESGGSFPAPQSMPASFPPPAMSKGKGKGCAFRPGPGGTGPCPPCYYFHGQACRCIKLPKCSPGP